MFICICNAFNDKTVQKHLDEAAAKNQPVKLGELYKACSGGKPVGCGTCCRTVLGDMVKDHNKQFPAAKGESGPEKGPAPAK